MVKAMRGAAAPPMEPFLAAALLLGFGTPQLSPRQLPLSSKCTR